MASSILDRYGIKEVADVMLYEIDETTGGPGKPVLYLDTLKVSTIEQTAEQTDARGGKGNPKLITWDYGKEITLTLEDALFSPKSMSVMMGDGSVTMPVATETLTRNAVVRATSTSLPDYFTADISVGDGAERRKVWMSTNTKPSEAIAYADSHIVSYKVYDEDGTVLVDTATAVGDWQGITTAVAGKKYFVEYVISINKKEIVVSADKYPGTYYLTGNTYARNDVSGKDQFFQFIVPKAKMTAEQTITLEAEGDPSTFSMNMTVLRPENGEMMKLVQYDIVAG